jgi:hypothetical protein
MAGCVSQPARKAPQRLYWLGSSSSGTEAARRRAFAARFGRHLAPRRTACRATLVREHPWLAMTTFVESSLPGDFESERLRRAIAEAWFSAFEEDALLNAERARAARPKEYAAVFRLLGPSGRESDNWRRAAAEFERLGDPFWVEFAARTRRVGAPARVDGPPFAPGAPAESPAPTQLQHVLRELAGAIAPTGARDPATFARASKMIPRVRETGSLSLAWQLLAALEGCPSTRPDEKPVLAAWRRAVARLALRRGEPLLAIRAISRNVRRRPEQPPSIKDELILARAHLVAKQPKRALDSALGAESRATKAGRSALQAEASAIAADALFALGRWPEAARLYRLAADSCAAGGDGDGRVRNAANAAQAELRAGHVAAAKADLRAVAKVAVKAETDRRRAVVAALILCSTDQETAGLWHIRELVAEAEKAGDVRFVERYAAAETGSGPP